MALRCRLFGHNMVEGYWIDTDSESTLEILLCERCDKKSVDLERFKEQ